MDPTLASKLTRAREEYRAELATALVEDADPLAAYDAFIKWTLNSYGPEHLAHSGLLELLEEATRHFVDDDAYKSDLRYLKLWLLYANHVEDPTVIYAFVLSKDIGKIYAQTYWEYADALERKGKRSEAAAVYQKGIQRRARPVDPLKRRFEDFKTRTKPPPPKSPTTPTIWQDAPSETRALRRAPLKNHTSSSTGPSDPPSSSRLSSGSGSNQPYNPYELMLQPPPPGKRKEYLRFNLSLLFTAEGHEYCMQEARARSMGLLGKKWGPPPDADRNRRVGFSGDPSKGNKTTTRKFATAEPTVTLATKEALADVFGMYNSPEKSMRFGPAAGSKHAPVREIKPMTPMGSLLRAVRDENGDNPSKTPFRPFVDENADVPAKPSFKPFVDENAVVPGKAAFAPFVDENAHRENRTPAAASKKIVPFVDPENAAEQPPGPSHPPRPALGLKDTVVPSFGGRPDENAQASRKKITVHIDTEEPKRPNPPPVFTPASATFRDRPRDIFSQNESVFRPPSSAGAPRALPFSSENVPPVFSLPPPKGENAPPPVFTPFLDKRQPLSSSSSSRPVLGDRGPLYPVFSPPDSEPQPVAGQAEDPQQEQESLPETPTTGSDVEPQQFDIENINSNDAFTPSESSEDIDDDYGFAEYEQSIDHHTIEVGDGSVLTDEDETSERQAPLGGRFGQFDVMTPIMERTYEYTMSTRGGGTPAFAVHRETQAAEVAARLAAELQEDDDEEVATIEERTGTLSLADALGVASSFKPPNPCVPTDPQIVSTLLRLIPPDPGFHDLRSNDANQLDALQKFAKKKTRRASGTSTSGRQMQDSDTLDVQLHDRRFAVVDKLGEGGFGAVFEAIDLNLARKHDDDEDDEDDEDEEDEDANRVALKVVKPRDLWEFHILRRIHATLSAPLRRSIVTPQALYAFRDESFLVLQLRKQGTLLDIVNRAPAAGITQAGGLMDELLVMFFAIELLRTLEGLHRAGFVHGDVKIDNCLLRLEDVPGPASAWAAAYDPAGAGGWAHKGVLLVDFGRATDTRLFPAGQRFVADWAVDARDCAEMRDGRPWTFQPDYFGLAGVIFCMLYGKYIDAAAVVPAGADASGRVKLAAPFKRYWQGELWTRLFDVLLNPTLVRPDGSLPVTDELAAQREEMEAWLQANCNRASNSLKGLLKKIGLAILGGKG